MKTKGSGGLTTITVPSGNLNISTTNLVDYRNLLKRLTVTNRIVNDATHAVFQFALSNNSLFIRTQKALEGQERWLAKAPRRIKLLHEFFPVMQDSVAVVRT